MKPQKAWRLGLIGYPLEHSGSPVLHRTALAQTGLTGTYRLYPLVEKNMIPQLLDQLRSGELDGLNVTIPYKQTVLPLMDQITPAAQAIGAVNTIINNSGLLVGDNTDADGFWKDISPLLDTKEISAKTALVLGAGGAARAVVYELVKQGWQVTLVARRLAQAEVLLETLELPNLKTAHWDSLKKLSFYNPYSLLVNATPVGMFPHQETSPIPDEINLPTHLTVYDLIYNPYETMLLKKAKLNGNAVLNGIGMLVNQAAQAFSLWTDKDAPVDKMKRNLLRKYGLKEK